MPYAVTAMPARGKGRGWCHSGQVAEGSRYRFTTLFGTLDSLSGRHLVWAEVRADRSSVE
jgi:hypothetical protein